MFLKLAVFLLNREIEKTHNSHGTAIEMSKLLNKNQLDDLSVIAKEASIRRAERIKKHENQKTCKV